jgi:hypothetical protein
MKIVGLVLGVALIGGVAYAAIPDAAGVYTACKLNVLGTIRLIDPSGPSASLLSHCTVYETQITWNQGGPTGLQGPRGDKGAMGDKGPAGDKGEVGSQGPLGERGLVGDKGASGDKGPAGDKGDVGSPGPVGDRGPVGDKGASGDKGLVGDKGADGGKGLPGDKGPTGDTGAQGPAGPAGTLPTYQRKSNNAQVGLTLPAGSWAIAARLTVDLFASNTFARCDLVSTLGDSKTTLDSVSFRTAASYNEPILVLQAAATTAAGANVNVTCLYEVNGAQIFPQWLSVIAVPVAGIVNQ